MGFDTDQEKNNLWASLLRLLPSEAFFKLEFTRKF